MGSGLISNTEITILEKVHRVRYYSVDENAGMTLPKKFLDVILEKYTKNMHW
jgi:hypothetical protein